MAVLSMIILFWMATTWACTQSHDGMYRGYEEICWNDSAGVKHCYGDRDGEQSEDDDHQETPEDIMWESGKW